MKEQELQALRDKIGYVFYPDKMKDKMLRYYTRGLFKELPLKKHDNFDPVFTAKNYDRHGLPSFKRLFVELNDPSGYIPAMVLLGSWDHWLKLCEQTWFQKLLVHSTEELEVKLRAQALMDIRVIAESEKGGALAAAKYLAEGAWKKTQTRKGNIGRPKKGETKKEIEKEQLIQKAVSEETEDDYERLFGVVEGDNEQDEAQRG